MDSGSVADWFAGGASALAAFVALGGYWVSEWQRNRDKREREHAAVNMIGMKLSNALNRTDDIRRHIWEPYEGTPLAGIDAHEIWRRTKPLLGLQDDPSARLNDAEINLLIRVKQTKFLMELMLVIDRYQSITSSMKEYGLRYEAIMALYPPPAEMNEDVAIFRPNQEQYLRLKPYSNALETLIRGLRVLTAENVEKAKGLADEFSPIMKASFKKGEFLKFGIPTQILAPPGSPG